MLLSTGASLQGQNNGNESYFLALRHHFEAKNNGSKSYFAALGSTSRPKIRQQSYFLALGHHFEAKTPAKIVIPQTGAPLEGQNNGSKSYFLALGHHFDTKTTATNRTSWYSGTNPRPEQRQQIVLLSTGASLRGQNNGNKSYFFALGHHFEAKTTATNRTS